MPKSPVPPSPLPANLSHLQMQQGIQRIQARIDELTRLDTSNLETRSDPKITAIEKSIEGTLTSVFGHDTIEYRRYISAASLYLGPSIIRMDSSWTSGRRGSYGHSSVDHELSGHAETAKNKSIAILGQAIEFLTEELSFTENFPNQNSDTTENLSPSLSRKIFIVHGHDSAVLEGVARFVEKIGLKPIILHEQPNSGRTIIEKVEANKDVGFAIILLTPDDVGSKKGETPRPRARQNVVLELGFFIGHLGRSKVCAILSDKEIEIPSDISGIIWQEFDTAGAWKRSIGNELQAAGYEFDWNKVMK